MATDAEGEKTVELRFSPARIGAAVLLTVFGLLCVLQVPLMARITGHNTLNAQGMELIDASLERNQTTFLMLSGIKAGMALLEGSTVGVGISLEVGDIVQPAYDYVDFFWTVFLYALVVLGVYKILLETGMLELGIVLMGSGALLYALGLLTPTREQAAALIGRRCILVGILIGYIVPASLLATQHLIERYTEQLKQTQYESIDAFRAEIEVARADFLALREKLSLLSPNQSIEVVKQGFLKITASVAESFKLSLQAFLYYILLVVFDLLFFPLLSAWVLYKFLQVAFDRALQRPAAPMPITIEKPEATEA